MGQISLAPMYRVTNPAFRLLIRKLSKEVLLFSEIIVESTIRHIDNEKLKSMLGDPEDKTVIQIGGSDPLNVALAVEKLSKLGYTKFNLNCGCPSDRVQKGLFGAILMNYKELVVDIVNEVYKRTGHILSIKTRTGVDNNESYEFFKEFILHIASKTPCNTFYIHARKCWLKGLSPKKNRNIPHLNYEYVYRLKKEHSELFIVLNGGISESNMDCIKSLDGAMIGRAAIADILIFNKITKEKYDLIENLKEYLKESLEKGFTKHKIYIPLINIYKFTPFNKRFRNLVNSLILSKETPIEESNNIIIGFLINNKIN